MTIEEQVRDALCWCDTTTRKHDYECAANYKQSIAQVIRLLLAEREACARAAETLDDDGEYPPCCAAAVAQVAHVIRARA